MSSNKSISADSTNNPQSGQGRPLPKKEADLFKNVVKFYESKQYKKGLKNAETILKRFPNHGETLCMKGLIINSLGAGDRQKDDAAHDRRQEAIDLVKRGLMMDMRSHVCWHVYGLLYRSTRDYPEAIKAYKQALRIDPENLQILRDLSLLQIQMRDLLGFRETRLKILTLRPNSKVHWLSYALGVHICGDPEGAIGVLDSYVGTLEEGSSEFRKGFESSELALYKNRVLSEIREAGNDLVGVKKALDHLEEIRDVIVDRTGWLQAKLSYQLQLGMFAEAEDTCLLLFQRGCTEDHRVHGAFMCAILNCDRETCLEVQKLRGTGTLATLRPLSDTERKILIDAYEDRTNGDSPYTQNGAHYDVPDGLGATRKNLAICFPRSAAVKRIYLTLLHPSSECFRTSIDKYCQRQLVKGVPSLGSDLSSLYLVEQSKDNFGQDRIHYVLATDPVDIKLHPVYQQLVELTDSYIHSLSSRNTFPNSSTEHPPSTLLWAWYLRSILYEQAAEYANGVALINKCIEHTPTGVDFYELKARLLEAGGDIQQAADVVDSGRDLDHQDRYINNQTTKTLLRAGREDDAKKRIAMFAIHEGDPEQNLYDMQCTWFELELADSCRRRGQLGKSLRKYMSVIKHYEDYHEDQFDFHAYCIRKVTLRTYCELLKFEDEIWGLPFYGHAAQEIIKIYLHILDKPIQSKNDEEPDYSKMTSAERKKAKNIARKKKKSQESSDGNGCLKNSEDSSKSIDDNKKKGKHHPLNEDPNGLELLALDPTSEAKKFAAILVRHAPKNISSWVLQYDVSVRRGKMLMALQALCKIKHIDVNSHHLFSRIVDFSLKLASTASKGHPSSEKVISTEFPKLMSNQSLEGYIQSAFQTVKADPLSSLPLRLAVAKAMISAGVGSSNNALSLILDSQLAGRGVTIRSCREAFQFIASVGPDNTEQKEIWKILVTAKFPFVKDL